MKPALTPQQEEYTDSRKSKLYLYKNLAVGESSYFFLAYYELCTIFLSNLSGIIGYALRSLFYPKLFNRCGKRTAFGRSLIIRDPNGIKIGDKLLIDDYAVLDARGGSIELGDYVSLGRFTTIAAKGGAIQLQNGVNVGSYCRIATQSRVEIGESTLIAAYCYIGPGNHQADDGDTPLISRTMEIKGGVKIGRHAWIGARCTILDGVTVGERAIIGAHSLVKEDVPAGAVVAGVPARRIDLPERA